MSTHNVTIEEATNLIGRTVHVLNNTKYAGVYTITGIEKTEGEWVQFQAGRIIWSARLADMFDTEAKARAEGKARRKPRQARQPLYGDYAWVAAFNGLATDGSGRSNIKAARKEA